MTTGPIDRRDFLGVVAASALATTIRPARARPVGRATPLRTITYNVLACRGYPATDENREVLAKARPQMPARMALELGLHEPDIVTFQESPAESLIADIAERLGMNHTYFPGGFPGAVMTRFEIAESTNKPVASGTDAAAINGLYTRHWGRAVLETDDGALVIHSAHLHPSDDAVRAREVTHMLAAMKSDLESGGSVILQGDLNHTPDEPEYARWVDAGLHDAFTAGDEGDGLTIPSTRPKQRIDYVWAHGPLAARACECRVLFEGAFRTNRDDPTSFALSDHIPVLAVYE